MKLVVGLGNPGSKYRFTRHNVGFLILESLETRLAMKFVHKFNSYYAKINYQGTEVVFLMPLSYMNLSGDAVTTLVNYYKIKPEAILVVYDEINLEFGRVQFKNNLIRTRHNGLRDIVQKTKNSNFCRFRIGVGKNMSINTADWVLGNFSNSEKAVLFDNMAFFQEAILDWVVSGDKEIIMNKYNNKLVT